MNQPPPYPYSYDPRSFNAQPLMPKPKKKPLWPWVVALVLVAFVALCCIASSIFSSIGRNGLTVTPTGTWTTTHTIAGAATKTTDSFVVTGPWKLKWTCAPHTNYFGSYNLIIRVVYSDGKTELAVNTICNYNNIKGEVQEANGGTASLDIIAEGEWVMNIQELE